MIAVSLPAALLVAAGWWWSAQAPSAPPAAVLEGTRVASPPAPPAPRAPELRELAAPEPSEPAAPTPPSPEPAASEPALTAPGSRGPQSNVYMADVPPRARRTRPPEAPLVAVGEPPPDLAPSIEALRAGLRERGILTSDLSAEQRRALDALAASGDPRSVEALERELAGVRVDEAFVRRKLGRIDERMRSARARGLDTRSLEPSSALALQELFEGRHEDVNRRLNELSRRLDALERNASHK